MKEKIKQYGNYFIILILSLISVFFLPMLGTSIDLAFVLPTTPAGWLVWIVTKLAVVAINMLLFDQFIRQGKLNIKDNKKFLAADRFFNQLQEEEEEKIPTPAEFFSKMYRTRGSKVILGSALSAIAFSNALLTFDWVSMLTYLFTVIGGCVYGWMSMLKTEDYWTDTYFRLAKQEAKKRNIEFKFQEEEELQNVEGK